jgi:catalase
LYRSFSKKDQDALIFNLSGALKQVKNKVIVAKMIAHFYQADSEYGIRLAKELKMDRKEIETLMMQ